MAGGCSRKTIGLLAVLRVILFEFLIDELIGDMEIDNLPKAVSEPIFTSIIVARLML